MLDDYFSLEISEDGRLVSLPMVFDDHVPAFAALPVRKSHCEEMIRRYSRPKFWFRGDT